jgi:catechol 2,3-dioxygenase
MLIDRRTLIQSGMQCGLSASMATTFQGPFVMTAQAQVSSSRPNLDPLHPGLTTLHVRDLESVARYYEDTIGLHRIDAEKDSVRLGAGKAALLHLIKRPGIDLEPRGFAGLFHTAFLLPSRADLGRWLHRAINAQVTFDGASDHTVSEALYLTDPEGNGIEIYADRPRDSWSWSNAQVQMATDPLDVQALVAAGGPKAPDSARMPDGTIIGHIHLRVGGIPEAEQFYRDVLGLDVTARRSGATFYATGGYHHHIATNIWGSRNAPKRSGTITGLAAFELAAIDAKTFDAAAARALAAGGRRAGETIEVTDPWLNQIVLRKA